MRSKWGRFGEREPSPVLRVGAQLGGCRRSRATCAPFVESLLRLKDCDVESEGFPVTILFGFVDRLLYFGLVYDKRAEGSRFVFG